MAVTGGLLLNWLETTSTKNEEQSWNTRKYPYLKRYIPLSKASSNSSRQCSRLLLVRGTEAPSARVTKRRVTTARRRLNWLRVPASVGYNRNQRKS